jgi:hypothetical protein
LLFQGLTHPNLGSARGADFDRGPELIEWRWILRRICFGGVLHCVLEFIARRLFLPWPRDIGRRGGTDPNFDVFVAAITGEPGQLPIGSEPRQQRRHERPMPPPDDVPLMALSTSLPASTSCQAASRSSGNRSANGGKCHGGDRADNRRAPRARSWRAGSLRRPSPRRAAGTPLQARLRRQAARAQPAAWHAGAGRRDEPRERSAATARCGIPTRPRGERRKAARPLRFVVFLSRADFATQRHSLKIHANCRALSHITRPTPRMARPRRNAHFIGVSYGSGGRDRTGDLRIMIPPL